eukprot:360958-Chlamydomonas_euryale.AAC.11
MRAACSSNCSGDQRVEPRTWELLCTPRRYQWAPEPRVPEYVRVVELLKTNCGILTISRSTRPCSSLPHCQVFPHLYVLHGSSYMRLAGRMTRGDEAGAVVNMVGLVRRVMVINPAFLIISATANPLPTQPSCYNYTAPGRIHPGITTFGSRILLQRPFSRVLADPTCWTEGPKKRDWA